MYISSVLTFTSNKGGIDNGINTAPILSIRFVYVASGPHIQTNGPTAQSQGHRRTHGRAGGAAEVGESRQPIKKMINIHVGDAGGLFLSPFP